MSKVSNIIQMLDYLNTGNKYSLRELSEKLEVSERMIRYYKQELEKIGIYIESFMGPNGGYYIFDSRNYYTKFNKYDVELLKACYEKLKNTNFKYIDKMSILIEKITNLYAIEEEKSKYIIENNDKNVPNMVGILKKYIENKDYLEILYEDISGDYKKRVIHPIYLFKYNNNLFVTAYCELRNDIRHFELSRIKAIK